MSNPIAADARRASALILHQRNGNSEGVVAILTEAGESKRQTELLMAVMDLYRNAFLELKTNAGIELMAQYVQAIAKLADEAGEGLGADMIRAARLLDAHGREDMAVLNATIHGAATTGRSALLLIGLLDLYEALLPELNCAAGLDWFNRMIVAFASEEVQ